MAAPRLKHSRMGFILMGDYNACAAEFLEQPDNCGGFNFVDPSIQEI